MKVSCDVIMDLMPLVKDGVASQDSEQLVWEHVELCSECRQEWGAITPTVIRNQQLKDEKLIRSIKRSVYVAQVIVLVIGIVVGVGLTNSMGMFYNFVIMPLVGALGVLVYKKRWYLAPLAVFVLSNLWQAVQAAMIAEEWSVILSGALTMSIIYTGLVLLGTLIAVLLKYAFQREDELHD